MTINDLIIRAIGIVKTKYAFIKHYSFIMDLTRVQYGNRICVSN